MQSLPRQPWLLGSPARRVRLASGLALAVYVTSHLLNHALLNVSVAAADGMLAWQKLVWQGWLGSVVLYGALAVHGGLGLHALYARRLPGWRATEVWQMALGLAVPAMLANHVAVTRVAWGAFALDKGYVAELAALWVRGPAWGWLQMAVLVAAWAHACLGIWGLLRLRRWWPAWQAPCLAAAVLLPVLAVLGFAAGGRMVAAAMASPAYVTLHLPPAVTGTPAQVAWLAAARNWFLVAYAGAILAVLIARGARWLRDGRSARITVHYPAGLSVAASPGMTVLDASRLGRVAHASACGGRGRCSTCRVQVLASTAPLPQPAPHELAVLGRIGADPARVRLACQLKPAADVTVAPLIAPEVAGEFILGRAPRMPEEERFLAVMFIDLRGSTGLTESRMPFDSVFLLSRFITVATQAVVRTGGRPVQFLGDGLLALFGLDCAPDMAARQALAGLRAAQAGFAALAPLFGQEAAGPLRYGIGLHCGRAIVGEFGFGQHVAFSVLGETVNLAHRLQELARDEAKAACIADMVFELAGEDGSIFEARDAQIRGRTAPLRVRLLPGSWG